MLKNKIDELLNKDTKEEFAKKNNISYSTLRRWEKYESLENIYNFFRLAKIIGLDLECFFEEYKEHKKKKVND